ncbi:hypothetical protein HDU98_008761 [Podochytrium sp. JEL0797]|nr:hypothetical protein HDU98_008761 [Podochytrium sp. JEL0797]
MISPNVVFYEKELEEAVDSEEVVDAEDVVDPEDGVSSDDGASSNDSKSSNKGESSNSGESSEDSDSKNVFDSKDVAVLKPLIEPVVRDYIISHWSRSNPLPTLALDSLELLKIPKSKRHAIQEYLKRLLAFVTVFYHRYPWDCGKCTAKSVT